MIKTEEFVEMKFAELLKCNAAMNDSDKKNILKAFEYANDIFRNDKLPNGTPYILHNINVAITALKEIGLGPTSAICALLHGDSITIP